MKIANELLAALLLMLLATTGIRQQSEPARLAGVIVKAGDETPLPRITVELQNSAVAETIATTTNEKGEFTFLNIAPGQYGVVATGAGYVRAEFGQSGLTGSGIAFSLAAAQQKTDVRLAMTPTAVISGRVVGPSGTPLTNADVVAFQESYSGGQRGLSVIRAVRTNDLGEYRIFWLPPGGYYIGAQAPEGIVTTTIQNNPNGTDSSSIFGVRRATRDVTVSPAGTRPAQKGANLLTYFPGTFEGQMAQIVIAQAGSEIRNVNFAVRPIDTYRVHGNILGAPSGSTVQIRLLRSVQPPLQQYNASTNPATGTFDIPGVIPGPYILFATAPGGLSGRHNVEIGAADAAVAVSLRPDVGLSIRVRKEGQSEALNVEGLRVDSVQDPWVNTGFSLRRTLPAAGTLTASLPVGDYRIYVPPVLSQTTNETVPPGLRNLYVKSMRLDGIDVLNLGLHLEKQPEGALEVVLGVSSAAVSGAVVSASQSPLPGATVVLMPSTSNLSFRRDMYRVARSDELGQFRFQNVVPGDYRILALNDVEPNAWLNPDFPKPYPELLMHVDETTNIHMNVEVSKRLR